MIVALIAFWKYEHLFGVLVSDQPSNWWVKQLCMLAAETQHEVIVWQLLNSDTQNSWSVQDYCPGRSDAVFEIFSSLLCFNVESEFFAVCVVVEMKQWKEDRPCCASRALPDFHVKHFHKTEVATQVSFLNIQETVWEEWMHIRDASGPRAHFCTSNIRPQINFLSSI